MKKMTFRPVYLLFMALFLIQISLQSGYAQSGPDGRRIKECINQGHKHIKKKHNIVRVIKSFASQIPATQKYDGFLISAHKNLTYAILVCGETSLKNFQVGIFDEDQKGIKGAKSHALKGAWVSLLTWEPEKEGSYMVVVFSMGGEGEFKLMMMVK